MILSECQFLILIVIVFSEIQQLYFGEDEYQYFSKQAIVIETNETEIANQNFSNILNLIDNAEMLSKQLSSINRNLAVQLDSQLVITLLLYDKSACEKLYNMQINQYIIQCKCLEGFMILLVNNQSEIIDQITIKSIYNQQLNSISNDNYIIIYESFDSFCSLYIIEWFIDKNDLKYEKIIINGQDYSDSDIVGVITNIQFYDNNSLQISFSYLILQFNLLNLSKTIIYTSNNKDTSYFQLISLSQIHSKMVIYLDYKIEKIYEINSEEFRINKNFSNVEQVRYINQNILIKFESLLYIVNNKYIYNVIKTEQNQVTFLEQLPFILLFSKFEKLQIIKINSFPSYLQYSKATYLSIFWCFDLQISDYATIYQINKLPINKTIVIDNSITTAKFLYPNQKSFDYKIRRKIFGFPTSIINYIDINGVVDEILESHIVYSNLDKNTIILTRNQQDSYIKIIFDTNQTFRLYDEIDKIYFKHNYQFNFNKSSIIIGHSQNSLIFVEQQTLYCYLYKSAKITMLRIIFEKKINYFLQNQNQAYFYLENCTLATVDLYNFQLIETNQTHQVNFTMNLSQNNLIINIKPQSIDFMRQNSYTYSIILDNIIRIQQFVSNQYIIIFELIEGKILMKLYLNKIYQYYYLYQLPTYSFTIEYPLQYKIHSTMIAILAHNEQMEQFILIYDCSQQKFNSMIKFIQVDPDCRIFYFLAFSKLYYIYQNQLRFVNFQLITIITKPNLFKHNLDSYFLESKITIFLDHSSMLNKDSLNINLMILNLKQSLELLTQNKLRYFIENQKKVIPLNQINGNIKSVTYINGDTQRNLSTFILVGELNCSQFKQQICVLDDYKINLNAFDIELTLNINTNQLINGFSLCKFRNIISIYTLDENYDLKVYSYNLEGGFIKQYTISTSNLQFKKIILNSILAIGDFLMFSTTSQLQNQVLYTISGYSIQLFYINGSSQFSYISIIITSNQYFITSQSCCQSDDLYQLNFMILNYQFDIIAQTQISIRQLISDQSDENGAFKLSISEFSNNTDYLQVKLFICSQILQCYYFQLKFDLTLNIMKKNIINILRYDGFLDSIAFASTQYVILNLRQQYNIYNLNQENKYIIDSHQQIDFQDFVIKQYNQTHFITEQYNLICEIKLFQLQNFNIPCLNTCDESKIQLSISNSVNQLNLTFENSNSKDIEIQLLQINLQQLIIILTGILLFCYLRKSQKNNKKN